MKKHGIYHNAQNVQLAAELIALGARMQLLSAEIDLPRERLLKLYKEVSGHSPPKGMLPFSTEWFLTWRANIHASLFVAFHSFLAKHSDINRQQRLIKSYRMYLHELQIHDVEPVLSITRAWTLLRFFDAQLLETMPCTRCSGQFVVHKLDMNRHYVCGQCQPPTRMKKIEEEVLERGHSRLAHRAFT